MTGRESCRFCIYLPPRHIASVLAECSNNTLTHEEPNWALINIALNVYSVLFSFPSAAAPVGGPMWPDNCATNTSEDGLKRYVSALRPSILLDITFDITFTHSKYFCIDLVFS